MISFKLWGAMSPTKEIPATVNTKSVDESVGETKKNNEDEITSSDRPSQLAQNTKRCIGQAEIESSYFKVNLGATNVYFYSKRAAFYLFMHC